MLDAIMIGVTVYMFRLLARPFVRPPDPFRMLPGAWPELNRIATTRVKAAAFERYYFLATVLTYPLSIASPRRVHRSAERFALPAGAISLMNINARVTSIGFAKARFIDLQIREVVLLNLCYMDLKGNRDVGNLSAVDAIDLMPFAQNAIRQGHCHEHTLHHGFQSPLKLR